MNQTVALFGGSFNPPHIGHVLAVAYLLSATEAEAVWTIPVFEHAFGKDLAPYDDRRRMCDLAFGWLPCVRVLDIERELGGESRTLFTVEALGARYPDVALRLAIGSDVLGDLPQWHRFDRIAELAPPIVLGRTGHPHDDAPVAVLPEVSSTEVRNAVRAGEALSGRVTRAVEGYIAERGLYRS